ncbi:MAG: hypothetical protein SW833_23075 [Cyanobacteriota bacterium]|nr:hypothetical protein [Cyanobacteriota bacterium]
MSSSSPPTLSSIEYSPQTRTRAERALRCSPFRLPLWREMRSRSISSNAIAGTAGFEQGYTLRPLLELVAESQLTWLIRVGLLRREVDGQGITDRFRLTPLGRQLLQQYEGQGAIPPPSNSDRFRNLLERWFRLPL